MPLHESQALQRFQRSQQHSGPYPRRLAAHIEGEPAAIDEINVGVPSFQKQLAVARCAATEGMRRRVSDDVGFGLDDATGDTPVTMVVDEYLADEVAGQRRRISRQFGPAQTSNGLDAG